MSFFAGLALARLQMNQAEREITRKYRDVLFEPLELAAARAADFHALTPAFYDTFQSDAESVGFTFVADLENRTVTEWYPRKSAFVRVMCSPDGATRLAACEIVVQAPRPAERRLQWCDLVTELTDGSALVTTTTPEEVTLDMVPGLLREHADADSSVRGLWARHQERLRMHLTDHYEVHPLLVRTAAEVVVAWEAGLQRQRRHHQKGLPEEQPTRFIRILLEEAQGGPVTRPPGL